MAVNVLLLTLIAKVNRSVGPCARTRLAIAVLVAALGISMITSSLYGMLAMKPFWYNGQLGRLPHRGVLGRLAFAIFFTYFAHGFSQDNMPPGVGSSSPGRCRSPSSS